MGRPRVLQIYEEAGIGAEDSLKKEEWYQKGISRWEGVEASIDGVLGGYGKVNSRDVVDNSSFLLEVVKERMPVAAEEKPKLVALDCGGGVGRVTKNLLLRHFHEPAKLVEDAVSYAETLLESIMAGVEGLINLLDSDEGLGRLDQELLPEQAALRFNHLAKAGLSSNNKRLACSRQIHACARKCVMEALHCFLEALALQPHLFQAVCQTSRQD